MIRTAIRYMFSALAAVALGFALASSAIAGETMNKAMRGQHAKKVVPPLNMVAGDKG